MNENNKQTGETSIQKFKNSLARIGIEFSEGSFPEEDDLILRSSLGDVTYKSDSSVMKPFFDNAPQHIIDLYKDYERVAFGGLTSDIDGKLYHDIGLEIAPQFCPEDGTASLTTKGRMPRIVKIDHGAVAFFITEAIELHQKLISDSARILAIKQVIETKKLSIGSSWRSIMSSLIAIRPEILMENREIRIEKTSAGDFALTLNGIIQSKIEINPIEAADIYKTQNEKDSLEKELLGHQELIGKLEKSINESRAEINEKFSGILLYFQKNTIVDCSMPIAVGIDPRDDMPCVIVIAEIDDVSDEIPKNVLKKTILDHLTGKCILNKEHQNALGVTELIEEIERMFEDL